mmetsp:Transcript_34453/g.67992  ORF Transcript_34453/g.67992 Transcript_34453/m.67992 type:complete len:88 (+) Transcript_34453:903-1166(+)
MVGAFARGTAIETVPPEELFCGEETAVEQVAESTDRRIGRREVETSVKLSNLVDRLGMPMVLRAVTGALCRNLGYPGDRGTCGPRLL